MKKYIKCSIAIATLGIFLPAATIATALADSNIQTSKQAAKNQTLKSGISDKINDLFPGNNVEVTVFNDQVLLTGQVSSEDIKNSAAKIAEKQAKSDEVLNYISVAKPQAEAQTRNDNLITSKASTDLMTISDIDEININNVKFVTTNGVIYIIGTVTSEQATDIDDKVKQINGVKQVVDLLTIQ